MRRYIIGRLLLMIPTLVGVAILTFVIMRAVPGDIVALRYSGSNVPQSVIDQERHLLGLDKPMWAQFVDWMISISRFDLGQSLWTGHSVVEEVQIRLPLSLELAVLATLFAGDRDPTGCRRRSPSGHVGRLRNPRVQHRRSRDAQLLDRDHDGPDHAHALGMGSAPRLHPVLRGSGGESADAHPPRDLRRLPVLGGLDADDTLDRAGGPARGLRPHGARQGSPRDARRRPSRPAERAPSGGHGRQPGVRLPHRRPRRDGAGLQPQRHRQAARRRSRASRLHAHPGAGAAARGRVRARELRRRHDLHRARPAYSVRIGGTHLPASLVTELAAAEHDPEEVMKRRYLESTGRRRFIRFWKEFITRRPLGAAGLFLIIVMILAAIFAERIAPYDPLATSFPDLLKPPAPDHLFGTDPFGRDVFSRVVFGSRTALLVGFTASLVGCTVGLVLGVIGAYLGGRTDQIIQRLMDVLLSFPLIVIAIAVVAALGTGEDRIANVIAAVTVPIIPRVSRVVRSSALSVVEMPYIEATRSVGTKAMRIMFVHVAPNVFAPYLIMMTAFLGQAILLEASLSFLGLGVFE